MIRSGKLNKRIEIQQPIESRDDAGSTVKEWVFFAHKWARIYPLFGREFFDAAQTRSEVDHRIEIHYTTGITPKMRVKYGTRIFDIQAVININEGDIEMHLMCKERL